MKIVFLFLSMVVAAKAQGLSVAYLRLMNADTDLPVSGFDPIANGAVVDLATLPSGTNLTIEAITTGSVSSVKFDFAGQSRMEKKARWLMCGNNDADFFRCASLRNGFNGIIKATPFAGRNGGGLAGKPLSIQMSIVRAVPLVTMTVVLVDSPSNEEIKPLTSKSVMDLETSPMVNVHAILADDSPVESVIFTLDDVAQPTENNAPYELFNSFKVGFTPWEPSIGHHTLNVVAYSARFGRGTVLANTTIKLRVLPRIPEDDGYYDDDDEYGDDDDLYFRDDDTITEEEE